MKKGLLLAFFALALIGLVVAEEATEPRVFVFVDHESKAVMRFINPATDEKLDIVPKLESLEGVTVFNLDQSLDEVSLSIYLVNKTTGDPLFNNPEIVGPFPTTGDIELDYRGLRIEVLSPIEETISAEEETIIEEITTTTETVTEEKTAPVSGNVISGEKGKTSILSWGAILLFLVIIGVMIFMYNKKKNFKGYVPEEEEAKKLRERVKKKEKAITQIKEEVRRREKAERKKRRLAVELAKEDTQLAQLNMSEADIETRGKIDKQIEKGREKGSFY